jgi:hypothetical protein
MRKRPPATSVAPRVGSHPAGGLRHDHRTRPFNNYAELEHPFDARMRVDRVTDVNAKSGLRHTPILIGMWPHYSRTGDLRGALRSR